LTPADYFVWARGVGPVRRHYTCVHCGETREDPATEADLKRAAEQDAHGFHYHFAFERVAPPEGLHSDRIRKMLEIYTPRNLYALVTLTVKIDTVFHGTRQQDTLLLLLLHLLDRGTSFYSDPGATARLVAHKQFVEFNLWTELERATQELGRVTTRFRVDSTPALSQVVYGDQACAYTSRGSCKSLARALPEHLVALVVCAPPPRRLPVWALAYLWGAWILGRAAVGSLIPSLDPHKSDPAWERRWYSDLVAGAMNALARLLRADGHVTFVFHESWHQTFEALILAAAGARLELESLLFQPRLGDFPRREFDAIPGDYRIAFAQGSGEALKILSESDLAVKIRTASLAAGREVLKRRGQPLPFTWIHHAAYTRAARERLLAQAMRANTKTGPGLFVSYAVREGLTEGYAHDLDHYVSSDQLVWLRQPSPEDPGPNQDPLIDRVDDAVHELLARGPRSRRELENAIYRQFPGDLTPEAGLIELCARAYADEERPGQDEDGSRMGDPAAALDCVWKWRNQVADEEKRRAMTLLTHLGERLEYRISQKPPFDLVWEAGGEIAHGFLWRERAWFGDLARFQMAPAHGHLVIPETQVALAQARVRQLPLQTEAFYEAGWDFVRVPCAEKLLEQDKIDRSDLVLMAGLVPPIAGERTQLELF
jgi:hypothetical protein